MSFYKIDAQLALENRIDGKGATAWREKHSSIQTTGGAYEMKSKDSDSFFALIDMEGNRRVPCEIQAQHGPYGYAIHPAGKSNDAKSAKYTSDERELIQAVVLHGRGVRAKVVGGAKDGQMNTVALGKQSIRGYWLCPSRLNWVAGASIRPLNEGAK